MSSSIFTEELCVSQHCDTEALLNPLLPSQVVNENMIVG